MIYFIKLLNFITKENFRLGGADKVLLEDLTIFSENLGLAFQVADDILDVTGTELTGHKHIE